LFLTVTLAVRLLVDDRGSLLVHAGIAV